ncbi:pyridoxamine 5'-phosphate oxidase family protein [Solirubrobacter soli]|uniref:pyridoxamine 5'-phosphate oxidase family protein n=1 Tax=Solirubrobacter soli TaxID=363832 RepID=UPI00040AF042|nr:pyridoxamine 5'-phosphate oxidase family protein [Solirubrobacter soli]
MARFHRGELAVQRRAGVADRAAALEDAFSAEIPDVAAEFLAAQPWIVLGAEDDRGRMWATVLYGRPGFISVPYPSTVHIDAQPLLGDPLEGALNGPVGGLAIEPGTRRRMRLNGTAWSDADGISIELEQVYSNCPKYIATRHVVGVARPQPTRHAGETLDDAGIELLTRADTAFVATRGPDQGADASHRGGNPGFLRVVDPNTVEWPDYTGNSMFNTLGNIATDPATGLTVVDPKTGTTLYLSGRAEVLWESGGFPSAQRIVRLAVDATVRLDHAAPLVWELERPARNPPLQ